MTDNEYFLLECIQFLIDKQVGNLTKCPVCDNYSCQGFGCILRSIDNRLYGGE